ncbi:MAG: hypothetical protein GDA47_02255 [Rhodospirillales bacterium]|nr:hypothetical protein [Rhodospirillales bacterium]
MARIASFDKRREIGFLPIGRPLYAGLGWPALRLRRTALRDRASRHLFDPELQYPERQRKHTISRTRPASPKCSAVRLRGGSAEGIEAKAEAAA